jgi:hypothetical protein
MLSVITNRGTFAFFKQEKLLHGSTSQEKSSEIG